jgi:PhnB protein
LNASSAAGRNGRPMSFFGSSAWRRAGDIPQCETWVVREEEIDMAKAKKPVPEGHHTVTPQLTLDNAAQAIDWYKKALGAEEVARAVGPDGKVMHAEIRIGDSLIMLNDEMGGGKSPKAIGGSPASLWVYVENCDTLFNRAVAAGAKVPPGPMGQLMDQFWGDRTGTFTDPHGYQWTIATRKEDLTPDETKQRMDEFMKNFAAQAAGR